MTTKVLTNPVRVVYPAFFNAKRNDLSGADEYGCQVLVSKDDHATLQRIKTAVSAAMAKKWGANPPAGLRATLRDGDVEKPNDANFRGHYFFNCKSFDAPGVVDVNRHDVIDPGAVRSGDYCRLSLNASAYDKKGNRGVSLYLNNVQFWAKGDPIGNSTRAEDDFNDDFDVESAGIAPQPVHASSAAAAAFDI